MFQICMQDRVSISSREISINNFQIWRSSFIHWIIISSRKTPLANIASNTTPRFLFFDLPRLLSHRSRRETNNFRRFYATFSALAHKKWLGAIFGDGKKGSLSSPRLEVGSLHATSRHQINVKNVGSSSTHNSDSRMALH
jgi:hypothetical protein